MERKLRDKIIQILVSDLTQLEADALVNAANTQLWMGAGVAGALKRAGGQLIEQEAMAKGPIPLGEAIVTSAGKLKAKYVIHAATMHPGGRASPESVDSATLNALSRAQELKLNWIAFPALGTGVGGLSISECARIMLSRIMDHLNRNPYPKKVTLCLIDPAAAQEFASWLTKLS